MAKLKVHKVIGSHGMLPNEQRADWTSELREFYAINCCSARRSGAVAEALVFLNDQPEFVEVEVLETVDKMTKVALRSHLGSAVASFNKKPYVSKKHGAYSNTWPSIPQGQRLDTVTLSFMPEGNNFVGWVFTKDISQ